MPVLSKADQDLESARRAEAGVNPNDTANALDVIDDGARGGDGLDNAPRLAEPGTDDAQPQRPAAPVKSESDNKRDEIVKRFRADRGQEVAEQADDISDFARSGLPPEFATPALADPAAEAGAVDDQPLAPAAPRKIKLVVHGKDVEMTEDEVIAKAQVALASDNLLDETKARFKEADGLIGQLRDKVARADPPGQHQPRPSATQATDPQAPVTTEQPSGEHHADDDKFQKLMDAMQFGDPQEARALLENTIQEKADKAADRAVTKALQTNAIKDDGARASKVLTDFADKHPEIAKDNMARAAIESDVVAQQVDDIKALGVDPATLRPDKLPPTSGDIALAHQWYRANGFKVKSPGEMLENATQKFMDWRGVKATTTEQPAAPAPATPRVEVTVDRTARRATIPQQPSRTVVPRPDAARQQAPQPRDRSSIIADMSAKRGAPRGRVA